MTVHTWPGAELASARSIEHVVVRQCRASALAGGLAVAWRLGPLPEPEPLLGYVIFGIAVTLLLEVLVAAIQRDRADRCADDLIEGGFAARDRNDPVSRAVQERIRDVSSERNRRRLADALRWQLQVDAKPCAAGARYGPLLPVCGWSAHADLIVQIADAIERGSCDPRVPIRISRLLSAPGPAGQVEPDEVGAALRAVGNLLEDEWDGTAGGLGESTQLDPETAPRP